MIFFVIEKAREKAIRLLDEGATAEQALRAFLAGLDPSAEYYEGLRYGIQNMVFGGLDAAGARIFIEAGQAECLAIHSAEHG